MLCTRPEGGRWIDRMSDWTGKQVIAGIACDFLEQLRRSTATWP